ncbi:hypothetical protein [Lactobacillus amylovorus]|uniref:hypothetical protein n=1 Tax=Lactobacillus amylovorus TaxID=1604 RepID=UPI00232D42D0|nr:hypothetical protein [Lactobacillus amylovorus]MDB6238388.1 hypothetical protein [Lactobacillus amylovorus]
MPSNKKSGSVVGKPLSSKYGTSSNSQTDSNAVKPDGFLCISFCLSACKSNCRSECASACKAACRAECRSMCYGAGSDAPTTLNKQVKSVEDIIL